MKLTSNIISLGVEVLLFILPVELSAQIFNRINFDFSIEALKIQGMIATP